MDAAQFTDVGKKMVHNLIIIKGGIHLAQVDCFVLPHY